MNRIDLFTPLSLRFILLASAVLRSTAVAIDRSFVGQYLDCSWTTKDFKDFARTGHTEHGWPCREKKLKAWTEKSRNVSTIVCIGDSITQGTGVDEMQTYPHQLYERLYKQYNVVNLGVAGVGVRRLASSPSWSSYSGSPHWSRVIQRLSNVHTVIVQLGTNDAALETWNRTAFRDDYVVMLQFVQKMYPHADIITSIPPPCGEKVVFYSPEPDIVNNQLGTEITAATKLANLEGPPVNMQDMFASQNATAPGPLLLKDGLHPSAAGHDVMASAFFSEITRMIHHPIHP